MSTEKIDTLHYVHVVPGSQRYFCRVEGCQDFTARNVPYGYCLSHLEQWARGVDCKEKFGFPAMGTRLGESGAVNAALLSVLKEYVEWFGAVHGQECPADDTCKCIGGGLNARVNAVISKAEGERGDGGR